MTEAESGSEETGIGNRKNENSVVNGCVAAAEIVEGRGGKKVRPAAADKRDRGERGRRNPRETFEKEVIGEGGDGGVMGERAGEVEGLGLRLRLRMVVLLGVGEAGLHEPCKVTRMAAL